MRAAIIAGLMAVGMLAGCGGTEEDVSTGESVSPSSDARVEAQAMTPCVKSCTVVYGRCIQNAHGSPKAEQACDDALNICVDNCNT